MYVMRNCFLTTEVGVVGMYLLAESISHDTGNGRIIRSWTLGQCIAGLAVYFPAYAGTKLYCLVTETRVRKQLAQGRYPESNRSPPPAGADALPIGHLVTRAGFRGAHGALGPRPPTKRRPPTI